MYTFNLTEFTHVSGVGIRTLPPFTEPPDHYVMMVVIEEVI